MTPAPAAASSPWAWLEHPACRTAWVLGLVVLTWQLISPDPYGGKLPINDKLVHCLLFAVLGLSGLAVWPSSWLSRVLIGLAIYGLLVEIIQYQVPGRSFELMDWVADLLGLLLALLIWRLWIWREGGRVSPNG